MSLEGQKRLLAVFGGMIFGVVRLKLSADDFSPAYRSGSLLIRTIS
jgi:hypothetical protein